MSAHTVSATPLGFVNLQGLKAAVVTVTLSASYDSGGSVVDLSTSGNLAAAGFKTVTGAMLLGHETAASGKYLPVFVPAASNAAATGLLKIYDTSQAGDAETSGDLHASLIRLLVTGT